MQITSERHFQHSCEVYLKGSGHRTTVYGRTREDVLADKPMLARLIGVDDVRKLMVSDDWQEQVVVTSTKTVAMGLGPSWARVTRRYNAYGDPE